MTTQTLLQLILGHPLLLRLSIVAIVVTFMFFVHRVVVLLSRAHTGERSEPAKNVVYSQAAMTKVTNRPSRPIFSQSHG